MKNVENQLFEAAFDAHEATENKLRRFQDTGEPITFRLGSLRVRPIMTDPKEKHLTFALRDEEEKLVAYIHDSFTAMGQPLATCSFEVFATTAEPFLHDYFDKRLKLRAYAPDKELTLEERYALLQENQDILPCSQEKETICNREMDWSWFQEADFYRLQDNMNTSKDDVLTYGGTAHFQGDAFEFISGLAEDNTQRLDIYCFQRTFTRDNLSRETVQKLFFDNQAEDAVYQDRGIIGGFTREKIASMSYLEFKDATAQIIARSQEYIFIPDKSAGLLQAKETIEDYLNAAITSGVGINMAMEYLQQEVNRAKEKMQHKEPTR